MHSSGRFADDFTAFIECDTCGRYELTDIRHDPEAVQPWAFDCPDCGGENRPDLNETDPDMGRDD